MEQQIYNVFEDPGFRFKPSDAQKLEYLLRFVTKVDMRDAGFIKTDIDVYGRKEPWEIYSEGFHCGVEDGSDRSSYRYFITKLKKKGPKTYHRGVGNHGSWKQQDKGKAVVKGSKVNLGYKKSISYENKKLDTKKHGHWLMKEYELSSRILDSVCKHDPDRRDWVLCAIKMKPQSCDDEFSTSTMPNSQDSVCVNSPIPGEVADYAKELEAVLLSDTVAPEPEIDGGKTAAEPTQPYLQVAENWSYDTSMDQQQQGADSFAVQTVSQTLQDVPEACNSQQQKLEDWFNGFSMEFMDDKQQQDLAQLTYNWNDWDFVDGHVF